MSSRELVLFWKPPHPFSQWTRSPFEMEGERYCCAEQYMMAEKAKLFGDINSRKQILATEDPKLHKELGRLVENFNEAVWVQHREEIVLRASRAKFSQNEELKAFLLNTGDKELVEASPFGRFCDICMFANFHT